MASCPVMNVIVLNYKNWLDTIECLDSLLMSEKVVFRLIVVDNFSNNNSVEEIGNYLEKNISDYQVLNQSEVRISSIDVSKKAYFIFSDSNLGYGGGNNLGIRLALNFTDTHYTMILNNDTVVDKFALANLLDKAIKNPEKLIIGSRILYFQRNDVVQCYGGAIFNPWSMMSKYINDLNAQSMDESDIEKQLSYISGAAMLFNNKYFNLYGMFDERFFLYFEEIDLSKRMSANDKLGYSSGSTIYHKEGASAGSSFDIKEKSSLAEYYSFQSRIYFTKKYYPNRILIVYLLSAVYVVHRLYKGRLDCVKCIMKALIGK